MCNEVDGVAWVAGCRHNTPRGRQQRVQRAEEAAAWIAAMAKARNTVVQAGGHIGLWPLALADRFARVVTCEPHPENYALLRHNVAGAANIKHLHGAFGAQAGMTGLRQVGEPPFASGMWVCDGDGSVPVRTIDGLELAGVDAIVLDVEGMELPALAGAAATIERDHPLIWIEFLHHQDALTAWLHARGYVGPIHTIGSDAVFVRG